MSWTELPFTVTTPMFCGRGGSGTPRSDHFRIPELRGALAFWTRAILGAGTTTTRQLRAIESSIFGAAAVDNRPLACSVQLRVLQAPVLEDFPHGRAAPKWLTKTNEAGIGYLAGLGLYDTGSGFLTRSPISLTAGKREGVIGLRANGHDSTIAASLWCVSALGGIGARVRRGFGGVQFSPEALCQLSPSLAEIFPDRSPAAFYDPARASEVAAVTLTTRALHAVEQPAVTDYPILTARTWAAVTTDPVTKSSTETLARLGTWFREHRRVDRPMPDASRQQTVTPEYKQAFASWIANGDPHPPLAATPTAAYGLPIQYRTSSSKNATLEPAEHGHDRRPSPVAFHLTPGADDHWRITGYYFTDRFLPNGQMHLLVGRRPLGPIPVDSQKIHRYCAESLQVLQAHFSTPAT